MKNYCSKIFVLKNGGIYTRLAFFFSQIFTFCLHNVEKNEKPLCSPQDLVLNYIKCKKFGTGYALKFRKIEKRKKSLGEGGEGGGGGADRAEI